MPFTKVPLQDSQEVVLKVALFAAKDVRKAIEILFVNNFWQNTLSLQSAPHYWRAHASEIQDPEGKHLLNACSKNLPHITDIILTKHFVDGSNENNNSNTAATTVEEKPDTSNNMHLAQSPTSYSNPSTSGIQQHSNHHQPLKTVVDIDNQTPLIFASQYDNIDVASRLIALGCDVNERDTIITVGESALHRAAIRASEEMCSLLLENGADLNALDESGWNPLLAAVHHGRLEIVKLLLEKMMKEYHHNLHQMKQMLVHQANSSPDNVATSSSHHNDHAPDAASSPSSSQNQNHHQSPEASPPPPPNNNLNTAAPSTSIQPSPSSIIYQASSSQRSAVFIKHFTEIRDVNGCNVFHHAAISGSVELIDFLCNVAINNSTKEEKHSPDAKTLEKERHVASLMIEPAQITQRTPLHHAVESSSEAAVHAIMKRAGVLVTETIDVQDCNGDTALIKAARRGYENLVVLLLKSGADKEKRNGDGESALDIAAARRYAGIVKILSDRKSGTCCGCF